jgi:hypothetical protein
MDFTKVCLSIMHDETDDFEKYERHCLRVACCAVKERARRRTSLRERWSGTREGERELLLARRRVCAPRACARFKFLVKKKILFDL